MKRFLPLVAIMAIVCATPAHARWIQQEIKWQKSQVGSCGTCTDIAIKDTTYTVVGGAPDTTNEFSPDEAVPLPRGIIAPGVTGGAQGYGPYLSDTTVVGWLVLTSDSLSSGTSVAPSNGLGTVTWVVEGKPGGFGSQPATLARGWVTVDSIIVTPQAAAESFAVPIRTIGIGVTGNRSALQYSMLRARTLQAVGGFQAARVFWRYWKPN